MSPESSKQPSDKVTADKAARQRASSAASLKTSGASSKASGNVYFSANRPLDRLDSVERTAVRAMAEDYKAFLKTSVCAPWTAKAIIEQAEAKGFRPYPADPSKAKPGGKYYINNDYESVALVVLGQENPVETGFNIVGAHIDSPQLELKPQPLNVVNGVARLKIKTRGGGSWMTWFNRPLGIAGRVMLPVLGEDGRPKLDPKTRRPMQETRFVRIDQPTITIPLEPIHFNRKLNEGRTIRPEEDLEPLAGVENTLLDNRHTDESVLDVTGVVTQALAQQGIDLALAPRAELFLFPVNPPTDTGLDNSMIVAQGHDDRSMCYTAMRGLFDATDQANKQADKKRGPVKTSIAYFFDNEEVGSLDRGGARSRWVEKVASDVVRAYCPPGANTTDLREEAMRKSFIFSADVAHGWLPNQQGFHDALNAVHIGKGPALKADSDGHYATTASGIAEALDVAKRAGVPVQVMSTHQDVSCGTTIGPMIAANTGALTVDIGIPIFSMHAANEIASKVDIYLAAKLFRAFFGNM